MCLRAALIGLGLLAASPVWAGAWALEEGQVFTSFSVMADPDLPDTGLVMAYGEYGLRSNLTLGIDAHGPITGERQEILAFARYQLPWKGPNVWAVSLGGGAAMSETAAEPILRLGVHWGRGLTNGWTSADIHAQWSETAPERYKADLTLGWRLTERWTAQAQAQGSYQAGTARWVFEPSVLFHANDLITLQAGAAQDSAGGAAQLKLGVWLRTKRR